MLTHKLWKHNPLPAEMQEYVQRKEKSRTDQKMNHAMFRSATKKYGDNIASFLEQKGVLGDFAPSAVDALSKIFALASLKTSRLQEKMSVFDKEQWGTNAQTQKMKLADLLFALQILDYPFPYNCEICKFFIPSGEKAEYWDGVHTIYCRFPKSKINRQHEKAAHYVCSNFMEIDRSMRTPISNTERTSFDRRIFRPRNLGGADRAGSLGCDHLCDRDERPNLSPKHRKIHDALHSNDRHGSIRHHPHGHQEMGHGRRLKSNPQKHPF